MTPSAVFSTPRTVRILDPEQIAMEAGRQMPFLRLPVRASVFADRQLRLRQLAAAHPMRDYLLFIAELAQAQHEVLQDYATVAVPCADDLQAAATALKPPLPAFCWPRDSVWRDQLRRLLDVLLTKLPPGPARDTASRILASPDNWLDMQADHLLRRTTLGLDLATAPLIGAGLQSYFTHLVLQTAQAHGEQVFGRTDSGTQCPCCGSVPTASVTRIGADESGFRYLHCALCSTQWHYVRIKCSHCESTNGIHFDELEIQPESGLSRPATGARPGSVRTECCDTCGHYLKQVGMEKDPDVEPVADDLASIALDLLVSEAGFERSGHNLMLLFGDPEPDHDSNDGADG